MKKHFLILYLIVGHTCQTANSQSIEKTVRNQKLPVEIQINPEKIENRIDEKLYGFLLEHIYHSVSNGIWGENVWNRSFEELSAFGKWEINNEGEVVLDALNQPNADFRICRGKDYEVDLEVKRLEGNGTVLIGVRDQNRERMLTNRAYCYLGTDNNTSHKLELSTGWIWHTPVVKTAVSDHVPGTLRIDEWIKVRIRCQGNHLTGWVNNNKIFDQIVEQCPMDGAVTLGGENCRVAFRNIQITSLDENKIAANLSPVHNWRFIGKGTIATTDFEVLNHHIALRVSSSGKLAGIEQPKNFSIRKDDLLKGSVYLKGTVNDAYIQLMNGLQVLDEQLIQGITGKWQEYPVTLSSSKNVPWGTLRIITKEVGHLYIDQVSLMHQSSIDNQGFRVELQDAVTPLKPTILRWPGGSFSEQYLFENGIGQQKDRKGILRWDDFDPLSFGTDEFIAYCRKLGAEPQIVIPIGYHNYAGYMPDKDGKQDWLKRALDWIEYCNGDPVTTEWGRKRAENGNLKPYNVRYWEIDNEVWKMNPKLYAEITRLFSIEIKKRYPEIKVIGCGCGRLGREGVGLDSIMIHDVAEYIDYISPHYYQTIDKYGNDGVEEYGKYLDKLTSWIKKSKNPSMKIYLSEWNLEGTDMRTGLFTGGFLNRLEKTPSVSMAAPALFLRHTSATGWNNAFINFDQCGWFPAPNYVVLKLWRKYYLPNRIALEGDTKGINMIATASDNQKQICLKMVNTTDQAIKIKLKNGAVLGIPTLETVSASSLTDKNTMEHPDNIREEKGEAIADGDDIFFSLPAYSASVLMMKR